MGNEEFNITSFLNQSKQTEFFVKKLLVHIFIIESDSYYIVNTELFIPVS